MELKCRHWMARAMVSRAKGVNPIYTATPSVPSYRGSQEDTANGPEKLLCQ